MRRPTYSIFDVGTNHNGYIIDLEHYIDYLEAEKAKNTIQLAEHKVDPDEHSGWNFDFEFIMKIANMTRIQEFTVDMEGVDSVLLALYNLQQK